MLPHRLRRAIVLCCFSILLAVSCVNQAPPSTHLPPVEPIAVISEFQAAGVEAFVQEGREAAIAQYGLPRFPLRTVFVRSATSPFTTLEDASQGQIAIYLSRQPSDFAFWGQLSHEISHLLNARFFDCYVEGQSTLFAEQLITQNGMDWSGWLQYFQQGQEPFYGTTYFMMKEVAAIVGAEAMQRFLSFAAYHDGNQHWMHIDIDRWLASLPDETRYAAKALILRHIPNVRATLPSVDSRYVCLSPR